MSGIRVVEQKEIHSAMIIDNQKNSVIKYQAPLIVEVACRRDFHDKQNV